MLFLEFIILILVLLLVVTLGLSLLIRFGLPSRYTPPVVPSQSNVYPYLYRIFSDLNEKSVFYELGSGDGRIIAKLSRRFPESQYIGIEKRLFPYFASICLWKILRRGKTPSFYRRNFFESDLTNATHIYTYLFPAIMDDLFTRFKNELAPGTLWVSLDFPFTEKKPAEMIEIPKPAKNFFPRFNTRLYVYRF